MSLKQDLYFMLKILKYILKYCILKILHVKRNAEETSLNNQKLKELMNSSCFCTQNINKTEMFSIETDYPDYSIKGNN